MAELTNVQKLEVDRQVKLAKETFDQQLISYEKMSELSGTPKEMIQIIHKNVAKNTTVSELAYFLTFSKSIGLNPLNKEIWCYKDTQGNLIMFTGRDGFLKKNKEMGSYMGMKSSDVCEFDEFEIDMIEGTVKHKISNNRGKTILGAYCIVEHKDKLPTIVWLDFDEYNLGQAKWKTAPKMMIKKCAQSAALREAAGMTGIQMEESAIVKNDVVSWKEPEQATNEEKQQQIEDERLELLIQNCKNIEQLNKLSKECTTADLIELWEQKRKDLQK